ncbi:MAG: class I SAM-dependent methyltransferase [Candidatus Omnitrophica bacterium]|nr:class I SAM-dependent methyltransferase [Candidatus Omnitrophota bacterium]
MKERRMPPLYLSVVHAQLFALAGKIKAVILDKIFNIETRLVPRSFRMPDEEGGSPYHPTPYGRLEKVMRFLKPDEKDVFVDLGCGKGRAVFLALTQKFKKVIGIESDRTTYDIAVRNAANFRGRKKAGSLELLHMDASDFDPSQGTVFFMFNPFGPKVLEKVLANIERSLKRNPRRIRLIYYIPRFLELVQKQTWLTRAGSVMNEACPVWEHTPLAGCPSRE